MGREESRGYAELHAFLQRRPTETLKIIEVGMTVSIYVSAFLLAFSVLSMILFGIDFSLIGATCDALLLVGSCLMRTATREVIGGRSGEGAAD